MIHDSNATPSRREWLHSTTNGIGTIALAWLLHQEKLLGESVKPDLERQHFDLREKHSVQPARAKAMISLFMQGGPSHVDLLDPKPILNKLDGQPFTGSIKFDNAAQASSKVLGSPWKFRKHGQSGIEVSELLPHLAEVVDDITVVRSMHTGVNNHGQSIYALSNGRTLAGHPVLGSWLSYGLGTSNQNLPAFIALPDPTSLPVCGTDHWSNGWLPSLFQGTVVRSKEPRILNLNPPLGMQGDKQQKLLEYVANLNRQHLDERPGELDLEARISSYELAARMQTAASEALDLSNETEAVKKMYGLHEPATQEYGTRCLIARRLIERGVRFVQVFTRNQFWDHHGSLRTALPNACQMTDKPAAALVKDLKQRGLLDSTLVVWGGEMGRLPVVQNDAGAAKVGRDHNTYGFSYWLAGGGVKRGAIVGATDEFGHHAVENIVKHHDLHRTLLHLFGLDANQLSYKRNGREMNLLDGQQARLVPELLA